MKIKKTKMAKIPEFFVFVTHLKSTEKHFSDMDITCAQRYGVFFV